MSWSILKITCPKNQNVFYNRGCIYGFEFEFELSKQNFWDSTSLRYGWEISNLSTICPCGSKFGRQHSMSCRKRAFVTIGHNDLRDLKAKILPEVCNDTKIEPKLVPLSGEDPNNRTVNISNEVRFNVRARGFWERGQQAFFDSRVLDHKACQYLNKSLQQCHVINENENKMAYNK